MRSRAELLVEQVKSYTYAHFEMSVEQLAAILSMAVSSRKGRHTINRIWAAFFIIPTPVNRFYTNVT